MKTIIAFALSVVLLAACGDHRSNEAPLGFSTDKVISIEENKEYANHEPSGVNSGLSDGTSGNIAADLTQDLKVDNLSTSMLEKSKHVEKIIRTADIRMRVEEYKKARIAIEKAVLAAGGYISTENEQNNTYSITNDLIIRVNNDAFSRLTSEVASFGVEVHSKNVSSQDVTDAFVDLTARIKTKKEVELRYIELLKRANTIKDILEVENNIRIIREEIEAKEGQLKYLADQVSWSTINLSIYQPIEGVPAPDEPGFFERFAKAFGKGWEGLLDFLIGFIRVWPFWLIFGSGAYFLYRWIKKLTRKVKPAVQIQTPSAQP